jgi:hypothetical protein
MVNNFENMKRAFELEMELSFKDNKELFVQYYQAKMLDGIFNQQSELQGVIQKLNWINNSPHEMNKKSDQLNG